MITGGRSDQGAAAKTSVCLAASSMASKAPGVVTRLRPKVDRIACPRLIRRFIDPNAVFLSEARFMHALNYCMLLPGPEAQQLATYIGWLMHRTL